MTALDPQLGAHVYHRLPDGHYLADWDDGHVRRSLDLTTFRAVHGPDRRVGHDPGDEDREV